MDELADDEGPRQEPILTEREAARAYAEASRYRALEWLMAGDDPDPGALLAQLFNRPAWHRDAACRGMGPALFFPVRGASSDEAKAICARCPVRSECLDAALAVPSMGDVWAGLSDRGRRVLRRGAA